MKIYISGPMTGLPANNYPAFHRAAARLRNQGFEVISPAEIDHDHDQTWESSMRNDIKALMDANTVAVLPGWRQSRGSCIEVNLARELKMQIVDAYTLEPVNLKGEKLDECKTVGASI